MTASAAGYDLPGVFTTLSPELAALASEVPSDPLEVCRTVQELVLHMIDIGPLDLPPERIADKDLRGAEEILGSLLRQNPAPLHVARPPTERVVGTCRDFVVVSCALLRLRGIAARARCGFATYFKEGEGIDHWVLEYRHEREDRWVRIDAQYVGLGRVEHDADLVEGQFLTGGEAWHRYRDGSIDPDAFGVAGTDHAWGVAEIRGNAVRDLAALMRVETLPWDEWGRMTASYEGETGPDYDALMDLIAATCAAHDPESIARLYASEDLAVPKSLGA
ncbi:transglutaminase domain-containing protein [Glycomyces paridis]|uniref:Transglutaminase n=1 Tax=Glycomyces paridis TaxID=2126555 RepID=A0A4S8PDQ4_9ACTN|nr:transglutaminase domain-containing protein [Glycomyces paridis]THV26419.1 transglutaminase [Glycomyces paridis]